MSAETKEKILNIETALEGKWGKDGGSQYLLFRKPPFAGANGTFLKSNLPDFINHSVLEYEVFIENDLAYMNIFEDSFKEKVKYQIWVLSSGLKMLTFRDGQSHEINYHKLDQPKVAE